MIRCPNLVCFIKEGKLQEKVMLVKGSTINSNVQEEQLGHSANW